MTNYFKATVRELFTREAFVADKNPRIAGPRMGGNSSAVLESVNCRWASACGRPGRDSTTAGHALQRSRPASNAGLYPERRPPKAARTPAYLLPAVRFGCQWVHQLPGLPQGRGRRDSPSGSGRRFCGKGAAPPRAAWPLRFPGGAGPPGPVPCAALLGRFGPWAPLFPPQTSGREECGHRNDDKRAAARVPGSRRPASPGKRGGGAERGGMTG